MTTHTIKVTAIEAIRVEPDGEDVKVSALLMGKVMGSRTVDLNTVGAVIFAIERAAEEAAQAQMLRRAQQIAGRS